MISKKLVAAGLAVLFLVISIIYVFQISDLTGNILYLVAPFLAVVSGLYAMRTYRLSNGHGQVLAIMTAGLVCWLIGETLFFLFQFVWHISPYPSVADVFYLAGYPLLFAGLTKEMAIHRVNLHNFNKLFLTLIILLLIGLAVIVAYFGVYLAYTAGDPLLNNIISIAYGVGDLILIVPALFILKIALDYRGGKLYTSWILILIALFCMLSGDLLFAIFKNSYTSLEWPYTLLDLAYVACYLLFTFSFFYTATTIRNLHAKLLK